MTPAGRRVLVGLVSEALERGEVALERGEVVLGAGGRLLKDGQEVRAQLGFEPDGAGVRLGSTGVAPASERNRNGDHDMSDKPQFAPLPPEQLGAADARLRANMERSQRAALRQAAAIRKRRLQWPTKGFAPLPECRLVKKP